MNELLNSVCDDIFPRLHHLSFCQPQTGGVSLQTFAKTELFTALLTISPSHPLPWPLTPDLLRLDPPPSVGVRHDEPSPPPPPIVCFCLVSNWSGTTLTLLIVHDRSLVVRVGNQIPQIPQIPLLLQPFLFLKCSLAEFMYGISHFNIYSKEQYPPSNLKCIFVFTFL